MERVPRNIFLSFTFPSVVARLGPCQLPQPGVEPALRGRERRDSAAGGGAARGQQGGLLGGGDGRRVSALCWLRQGRRGVPNQLSIEAVLFRRRGGAKQLLWGLRQSSRGNLHQGRRYNEVQVRCGTWYIH